MAELRKMTWPTKDELIGSTIVVVVVSLIVADIYRHCGPGSGNGQ